MIVFADLVLGPSDGEHSDKVVKFLDKYRDRKNELAYYTSMSEDMANAVTSHVKDVLGTFHYDSGSLAYDQTGLEFYRDSPWREDDINDPSSHYNMLHKHISDFHKAPKYESDTDDFCRFRCQSDFFTAQHNAIITYYPYGPNPDPVEYKKYLEHAINTNEIESFARFLRDKGFNAHVVRGGVIDVYHPNFEPTSVFAKRPFENKKIYLFTNEPSYDIMNFPEGTEVIIPESLEDLLTSVAKIMKETKKP